MSQPLHVNGKFICTGKQYDEIIVDGDALISEGSLIKRLIVRGNLQATDSVFEEVSCKGNCRLTRVKITKHLHIQGVQLGLMDTHVHSISMERYPSWTPTKARIDLKGNSQVENLISFSPEKGVVNLFDNSTIQGEILNGCLHKD